MRGAWIRALVGAVGAAAILSYTFTGHALPQMSAHDEMAGATAGICLLLVSVAGRVALPRESLAPAVVGRIACRAPQPERFLPPPDARARASPIQLQRFRN